MSRNPAIEEIHAAVYDLETAAEADQKAARRSLEKLVQKTIDRSGMRISVRELLDALRDDYEEYKRARKREGWARIRK